MTKIRIGNIEYRESMHLDGTGTYEEIIRWFSNPYYNRKESMLKDGYSENPDGSVTKGSATISDSCFEYDENCVSIATILWNKTHDEFDVKSVGLRAFELNEADHKNLMRTLKLIGETNA